MEHIVQRKFDVHACTPYLTTPARRAQLQQLGDRIHSHHRLASLLKHQCPDAGAVVDKMCQRTNRQTQTYMCPDLGIDIWLLVEKVLWRCWHEPERMECLRETLDEMNGHCVQGDSHRLLCLLDALPEPQ